MSKSKLLTSILCLVLFMLVPSTQAQALPASPWYTIVYQPENNSLRWINAAGEQAVIARPMLPGETQLLGMRFSPDGRRAVFVAMLNNGLQALGLYNLETMAFVQIHQAQPGENISLGGDNIFSANSQYFAMGFFSGDFASPAWRVFLFDAQTGASSAFIDHTHPDAPQVQLSEPSVQLLDGSYVHFQLIPQAVGGSYNWPAYAWQVFGFNAGSSAMSESPYTHTDVEIQLLTGRSTFPYADANFALAPQNGPAPVLNAIGWGILSNGSDLNTVHADSTRYHLRTRWAKGGDWLLFLTDDAQNNSYWNIVLADGTPGNNSHMPFDPQFIDVYGTSDGYLLVNDSYNLFYTNGFMPNTAMNIAQLTASSQIVYVTPIGVNFMLGNLSGQPTVLVAPVAPPTIITATPQAPELVGPVDCSLAPPQRVSIGNLGRVLPSMGGLNMRQTPNGAIVTTLEGGNAFDVIGGAICDNGLYWWQVDRSGVIGWVAEGSANGYFIEPFDGVVPPPQPPQPAGDGLALPPAPTGCALAPRLSVGGSAIVINQMRPHDAANGNAMTMLMYTVGTSLAVNNGPQCVNGQNWWLVTGEAKVGRIGNRSEITQGWIAEGTDGVYNVAP